MVIFLYNSIIYIIYYSYNLYVLPHLWSFFYIIYTFCHIYMYGHFLYNLYVVVVEVIVFPIKRNGRGEHPAALKLPLLP